MNKLKFGIVGTGFISTIVANSIVQATNAKLTAVSSRKQITANTFVENHPGVAPLEGIDALLARNDVEAIYIGTPTTTKEQIALAAIDAGKHVLVDKPMLSHESAKRMIEAAISKKLVFMDATHFVHHPRTKLIREAIPEKIGIPKSLHTSFYFPFSDSENIRLDPSLEPTGALGDMAWYSTRAIVEYLQPKGDIKTVTTVAERDLSSNAVIRVEGLIHFNSGEVSTFDVGYTANTNLMDVQLIGTEGVIMLEDFVLDWSNSFAFNNPDIKVGYLHRTGMATRKEFNFIETPSKKAQDTLMIEDFAELTFNYDVKCNEMYITETLKTQQYLDELWVSVNNQ